MKRLKRTYGVRAAGRQDAKYPIAPCGKKLALYRVDDVVVPDWGDEISTQRENNRKRRAADRAAVQNQLAEYYQEQQELLAEDDYGTINPDYDPNDVLDDVLEEMMQ